jgi:RNA polymerase sigma-70 factor, ECF subfamily
VICHILLDVPFFERKEATAAEAPLGDTLAERVAKGDRGAFVTVYRTHFVEVHSFAERLLGCRMAADDLVHDVFMDLPRALARFRAQCPLRSYLLSITVRSARQHLRSAQRRRRLEARAAEAGERPHAAAPDVDRERSELAAALTRALDSLPLAQRAAFVLCEIEERSSEEAGQILGEKPGTLRARVFHAKRKLRERLRELTADHALIGTEVDP